MIIRIYQPVDAGDLTPGMALSTPAGTLVVDEVRKVIVGGGLVVDVYGLPRDGQDRKQRTRLRFTVGEVVHLEPTEDEAHNAWGHVTNAVREAIEGWDDPDGPPPWATIDHETAVTVLVGTTTYELAPDSTPPAPRLSDPDDES